MAVASGRLSCSAPGAPHRGPRGLVTLVGCLSTGPLYKSGFLKMKGFLCVSVEQRTEKFFSSWEEHPSTRTCASGGCSSCLRGLAVQWETAVFPPLPGPQDTLGMHPRTDPEACGGRRSKVGPVVMKGSSVPGGGRRGGQAWLLEPGEDFRLRPEEGEGVTEGFERKGWLR